jgi:hypothetical protein
MVHVRSLYLILLRIEQVKYILFTKSEMFLCCFFNTPHHKCSKSCLGNWHNLY